MRALSHDLRDHGSEAAKQDSSVTVGEGRRSCTLTVGVALGDSLGKGGSKRKNITWKSVKLGFLS